MAVKGVRDEFEDVQDAMDLDDPDEEGQAKTNNIIPFPSRRH